MSEENKNTVKRTQVLGWETGEHRCWVRSEENTSFGLGTWRTKVLGEK